jgi:homoserine dehydrogenase
MSKELKIAIAGLGTVGTGLLNVLNSNGVELAKRSDCEIRVTAVSARDPKKDRGVNLSRYEWFDDAVEMATAADADVFVELIGGTEGVALEATRAALSAGRDVVTANKAMLAFHGTELARLAEDNGCTIGYEAAVAGGIPIIKSMREGLAANRIERVYGILNGTCNYILTTMEETGRSFEDVLAEAQSEGYAEADPSFDVGGIDAAHKLSLLASLAFGTEVDFASVDIEGIERIGAGDIAYAREFGYRIKLVGVAQQTDKGVEQRVGPCLVPQSSVIGSVGGVFNAVIVDGDAVGQANFVGRGAGEGPTASAVAADIIDIVKGLRQPVFSVPAKALKPARPSPLSDHEGPYYLRLQVTDQPGVMGGITVILGEAEVSIDSIIQRSRAPGETVPIVILTHETKEGVMMEALERLKAHPAMQEDPRLIRIENF